MVASGMITDKLMIIFIKTNITVSAKKETIIICIANYIIIAPNSIANRVTKHFSLVIKETLNNHQRRVWLQ